MVAPTTRPLRPARASASRAAATAISARIARPCRAARQAGRRDPGIRDRCPYHRVSGTDVACRLDALDRQTQTRRHVAPLGRVGKGPRSAGRRGVEPRRPLGAGDNIGRGGRCPGLQSPARGPRASSLRSSRLAPASGGTGWPSAPDWQGGGRRRAGITSRRPDRLPLRAGHRRHRSHWRGWRPRCGGRSPGCRRGTSSRSRAPVRYAGCRS